MFEERGGVQTHRHRPPGFGHGELRNTYLEIERVQVILLSRKKAPHISDFFSCCILYWEQERGEEEKKYPSLHCAGCGSGKHGCPFPHILYKLIMLHFGADVHLDCDPVLLFF